MPSRGTVLINGIAGNATVISNDYVARHAGENAVIVEIFPSGTAPSITVQVLDSDDEGAGFTSAVDANGLQTAKTAYTKFLVTAVMSFIKIQCTNNNATGTCQVKVTPVFASNQVVVTTSSAITSLPLPTGGTLTALAQASQGTSAAALTAQACKAIIVQADPSNTDDVLVGDSTNQTVDLVAGQFSPSLAVTNASQVYWKAKTGTQKLNIWTVL